MAQTVSSNSLALLVDSMLAIGQHYSMDLKDLRALCVKMIVLSLKYVDRKLVWETLFPGHFVDWEILKPGTNVLGDLHLWCPLLDMFDWEGLDRKEQAHPPLATLRKGLRTVALDDGSWAMPCRLVIAQMLQGVPVHQAFEMLTCRILDRDTHQSSALLLAALSDSPFPPDMYENLFCVLLSDAHLRLDTARLEAHVKTAATRREDLASALKLKTIQSYHGRPRLRDRATPSEDQKLSLDTQHGTWESYVGFCQLHQFPNVLSEGVKSRLYFLASQHGWNWQDYLGHILGQVGGRTHVTDLCAKVAGYPVSKPDLRILHRCIDTLAMDGAPPFQEMIDFKNQCFKSFPVSQTQRMNLTQFLRLYVCAYQNPAVWKELWKMQLCLLSPQIIKDCEAFAQSLPFNADAFVRLFLAASSGA